MKVGATGSCQSDDFIQQGIQQMEQQMKQIFPGMTDQQARDSSTRFFSLCLFSAPPEPGGKPFGS